MSLPAQGDGVDAGLPSFLRMGSWIGGDRDGNPFVTEEVLRAALRAQSGRALRYYLDELHMLGGELSLDSRLVVVSRRDRTARRTIARPLRQPAKRTLSAGRSPGFMRGWRRRPGCSIISTRPCMPSATHRLIATAANCLPISGSSIARSVVNGSEYPGQGRLKRLRRAVDIFGFHLAALDLRQNSDVHERAVGEMLGLVQPGLDYAGLAEPERIRLLLAELATARPLASPFLAYSAETASELAILRATAEAHRRYGAGCGAALRDLQDRPASPTCSKPRCW